MSLVSQATCSSSLIDAKGSRLAVYQWGTANPLYPTLVCIHGYPDNASVWTHFAEHLASHYHVVAYDVRGSGDSAKPSASSAYQFEHLTTDLLTVIDHVSADRPVHLVGYDWGALQGWDAILSGRLDGRVSGYSTAAPSLDHVGHWFQRRLRSGKVDDLRLFAQRALGSSYMLMMQMPIIPELTWQYGLGTLWPRLVSRMERTPVPANPKLISDAQHGLGLYRANLMPALAKPSSRSTDLPVQLLIMTHDPFVAPIMFDGMAEWAPHSIRTHVKAGHWWLLSQPRHVANQIAAYINQLGASPDRTVEMPRLNAGRRRTDQQDPCATTRSAS